MANITVRPVHFEDFGGAEFERLVFAYHLRAGWSDLAWYGQTGSDLGRDIIGVEPFDEQPNRRTIIQCVNRGALTQAKAEHDMERAAQAPTGKPDAFKFVCRSAVSSERRDAVRAAASKLGVNHVTIWSGTEFEEHLRLKAEFLLRRFMEGVTFPDEEGDLRAFVDDFPELADEDALQLLAAVLDRPAFSTPFLGESYLPAFSQAIEDAICAFNTGVWRTRDGVEIRRIPSVHHLRLPANRAGVAQVVRELDEVRRRFKQHLADKSIEHCHCGDPNCPTFMTSPRAAADMDEARSRVLDTFRRLYPSFAVRLR